MKLDLFYAEEKLIDYYSLVSTKEKQNLVLSFLHPDNPYRSLTICFKVGLGKTYAAAALSYIYLSQGFSVLYLSSTVNSSENFKKEYNKVIEDNRLFLFRSRMKTMTYSKVYNSAKSLESYDLIILDEAHNLKESGVRYKYIKDSILQANFSKVLTISGTPIVDSISEIDILLNISGERSDIIFYDNNLNTADLEYVGEKVGDNILFLSELKGKQLDFYNINKGKDSIYTTERQNSISCSEKFDKTIPLDEQSSKISKFIETLDDKPTVVFCFFVKRGINFLIQVLNSMGYKPYNKKGNKHYAVLYGGINKIESEKIINTYNNLKNINGDLINILIGSLVMSESITLNNTRSVHVLTPHWNFSQIEQSIGRTIRFGSHSFLPTKDRKVKVYLHSTKNTIDEKMYYIASKKRSDIKNTLKDIEKNTDINYRHNLVSFPEPDNILIFKINQYIWDFNNCFDKNKFNISWGKFYKQHAVCYNTLTGEKILGEVFHNFKIHLPLEDGYSIWRSCVDNKLRLSNIRETKNKKTKRGKLLENMTIKEIQQIAKDLTCKENISSIIDKLKSQNRFIDKQITIQNDL